MCEVAERENVNPSDYAIKSDAFFISAKSYKVYKVMEILITIYLPLPPPLLVRYKNHHILLET